MEKTAKKTAAKSVKATSKPKAAKKKISDQDIRNRAFEIYHANKNSNSTEMDNWLTAKKELEARIN